MIESKRAGAETDEKSTSFRFPSGVELTPPHSSRFSPSRPDTTRTPPSGEASGMPTPPSAEISGEVIDGDLQPGKVLFDKYVLIRQLGKGGMGEVWLVKHQTLGLERALKMILSGIAIDHQIRARFRREAQIMAKFSEHRNAVQVHDSKVAANAAFIEMEFVRGHDFTSFLRPGVAMPLDWVARILIQLCDVLQTAHEQGIVHRDLSPSNLMLVDGRPAGKEHLKVLDFGIAKILHPDQGGHHTEVEDLTAQDAFVGKWAYASPEQLQGQPIDGRSDLYSVGIMLFEFLTGSRPFAGSKFAVMNAHCHEPPRRFDEVNPGACIPRDIEHVVFRALAKRAEDRPQTARELADQFLQSLTSVPNLEFPSTDSFLRVEPSSRIPGPPTQRDPDSPSGSRSVHPATSALPHSGHGVVSVEATELFSSGAADRAAGPVATRYSMPTPPPEMRTRSSLGTSVPEHDAVRPRRRSVVVVSLLLGVLSVSALGAGAIGWKNRDRLRSMLASEARDAEKVQPTGKWSSLRPEVERQLLTWSKYEPDRDKPLVDGWPSALKLAVGSRTINYDRLPDGIYIPHGFTPSSVPARDGWPNQITRDRDKVVFVRIVVGTFAMGNFGPNENPGAPNVPAHTVELQGFYMQKHEVTNAEVDLAHGDVPDDSKTPGWIEGYLDLKSRLGAEEAKTHPAVRLSWVECHRLAAILGGQLPTEAQWEYAARSQGQEVHFISESKDPRGAKVKNANIQRNGDDAFGTFPVGAHPADETEHGLLDMTGNVREWCRDRYHRYESKRQRDPDYAPRTPQSTEPRVVRGGSFQTGLVTGETTYRKDGGQVATDSAEDLGFRVVIECPASIRAGSR